MNKENIIKSAVKLENLFIKYSATNHDASDVYNSCKPLLEKVKAGLVNEPIAGGWFHINLEPGFPLSNINELTQAASEFNVLLQGWNSLEDFRRDIGETMEIAEKEEAELRNKFK